MKVAKISLPQILFVFTTIVLACLLCICILALDNSNKDQDIMKWQNEASQLKNELARIKRYTHLYNTTPETVATVIRESEKNGIDPGIMLSLIHTESSYNPKAKSPDGARGLCQIRPSTAKSLAKDLGLDYQYELLDDPEYSITLAAFYLANLLQMHDYDYHKALTAYNRGPKGLQSFIRKTGSAVSTYSRRVSENSLLLAK